MPVDLLSDEDRAKILEGARRRRAGGQLHGRVEHDLTLHPPTPPVGLAMDRVRAEAKRLAHLLVDLVPQGREQSMALTDVEAMVAHAMAGMARDQDAAAELYEDWAGKEAQP